MRSPFSWIFHQEPRPWFGDQIYGNVIRLHAYGHKRSAHDETSHPQTNTLSVFFFLWVSFSY
jgi:hypothetical protein